MPVIRRPDAELPHEPGTRTRREFSATHRTQSTEPSSTIEGTVGGQNHKTGDHVVVRPGGLLLLASGNEVPLLPGQPTQVTLGTPESGVRRPSSQPQRFQAGLSTLDGAVQIVHGSQEPSVALPCSFGSGGGGGGGSPGSGGVSFNVIRNPEDDDTPPPPNPPPEAPEDDQPIDPPPQDPSEPEPPVPPLPQKWQCLPAGNCVQSSLGAFGSYEECISQCNPRTYNCVNGNCVAVNSGGGQYQTLQECRDSGCEPTGYACVDGTCQLTIGGAFPTLAACYASNCLPCQLYIIRYDLYTRNSPGAACPGTLVPFSTSVDRIGTAFSLAEGSATAPTCPELKTQVDLTFTSCAGVVTTVPVNVLPTGLRLFGITSIEPV